MTSSIIRFIHLHPVVNFKTRFKVFLASMPKLKGVRAGQLICKFLARKIDV